MKSAWALAAAFGAAFLPNSAFAIITNTLKAPNERFVLNARQALIAVEATSAKLAEMKKYYRTL